ncbi:hypothetical protein [Dyella sp.]|uniref:hypothetical protein n=1 Tax=Dyella sp. TaxID=1869338 RepID=UPI00283D94BB|nr:hypothetical protein [Dyella sp.]MDR3445151.1 hypothetical protein [Dyella sp.]
MDHLWSNAGFLLSMAAIIYGLWRQRRDQAPQQPRRKAKPKPSQSYDQWARESRNKVYKARSGGDFKKGR